MASVADIHAPRFLNAFRSALSKIELDSCVAFIIAGDIVERGKAREARAVFELIKEKFKGPIIAVFGNEDYEEIEDRLKMDNPDIIWLNDEFYDLQVGNITLRIIGSRGVLDNPTPWQRRNIPNIREIYLQRLVKLKTLLRSSPHPTILVTHYSPTYKTLKGEPPRIWPYMGSRRLEKVVEQYKPLIVIHGHAHKSHVERAFIDVVPVYNVSLPAFNKIFLISFKPRKSLLEYF